MKRIVTSLCALLALGVGAQLARASIPVAISEHISEVAQWAYRGGITRSYPSCGTRCGDLWTAEHAGSAEEPYVLELWREMQLLRERVEVLPLLGGLLNERSLDSASPTVIGVKMGYEPSRIIWLKLVLPAARPWTLVSLYAAEPDHYVVHHHNAGGTVGGVTLERDAWVIGGRYAGQVLGEEFQNECGPGRANNGFTPPVGGTIQAAYGASACIPYGSGGTSPVYISAIPSPVVTPSEDFSSQTAPTRVIDEGYLEDPGERTVQGEIARQLEIHADDYRVLVKWLDGHLGGTSVDPTDAVADLEHYRPQYDYNEGEEFYPQDAGAFTNNYKVDERGHWSFLRANMLSTFVQMLLAAGGAPREEEIPEPLNLDLLGDYYHDGERLPSEAEDFINARGSDVETYEEDSSRMREEGFSDVVYGRLVTEPNDGKVWLQYWIFYYDNSFAGWGNADQHEGDWEMTQVGLDEAGNADAMTFAIHERAWGCSWSDVDKSGLETNPDTPIVYPAHGSHASYPHAGITELPALLADYHYGDGIIETPPLHVLRSEDDWMNWKGRWGASEGEIGGLFASPHTPSQQGDKWSHPSRFHDEHLDPTDCEP